MILYAHLIFARLYAHLIFARLHAHRGEPSCRGRTSEGGDPAVAAHGRGEPDEDDHGTGGDNGDELVHNDDDDDVVRVDDSDDCQLMRTFPHYPSSPNQYQRCRLSIDLKLARTDSSWLTS